MVNSDQHVNLTFGLKSEICEEHAGDEGPAEDSSSDVDEVQFGKKYEHCYICNLWEKNSKTIELQRQIRTLTNNFFQHNLSGIPNVLARPTYLHDSRHMPDLLLAGILFRFRRLPAVQWFSGSLGHLLMETIAVF